MAKRRTHPVSASTLCGLAAAIAFVVIATCLVVFASTDCSETVTRCRHSEVDVN